MTGYVARRPHRPRGRRRAAAHRRAVHRGGRAARLPAAEPARHRPRRERPAGAAGRRRSPARCGWPRPTTLGRIAELGERAGRGLHPGEPQHRRRPPRHAVRPRRRHRWRWSRPSTAPHLRLNLDLYHAQIGEGNLIELVPRAPPLHRRDPGRRRARAAASRAPARSTTRPSPRRSPRLGYDGVVGLEAWAVRRHRRRRSSGSAPRSRFPRPAEPRAVATRPGPGRTPP